MANNGTNVTFARLPNATSPPSGCLVLLYQGFLPLDNPTNVISAQTEDLVRRWKDGVVLPVLFLISGPANVINMAVFYKQGLMEGINVCLFALALADCLSLLQGVVLQCEGIGVAREER